MELQQLRRDNSSLDAGAHEKEKNLTHLRTRVAVLEQELLDKEQVYMLVYYWYPVSTIYIVLSPPPIFSKINFCTFSRISPPPPPHSPNIAKT